MQNEKMAKWGVVVLRTMPRNNYSDFGCEYDTAELVALDDYHLTLEQLYEWTGCRCIQIVRCPDRSLLCLDDNGKCELKPINLIATRLYGNPNDFIVGDCVVGSAFGASPFDEPDMYAMTYEDACALYSEIAYNLAH